MYYDIACFLIPRVEREEKVSQATNQVKDKTLDIWIEQLLLRVLFTSTPENANIGKPFHQC